MHVLKYPVVLLVICGLGSGAMAKPSARQRARATDTMIRLLGHKEHLHHDALFKSERSFIQLMTRLERDQTAKRRLTRAYAPLTGLLAHASAAIGFEAQHMPIQHAAEQYVHLMQTDPALALGAVAMMTMASAAAKIATNTRQFVTGTHLPKVSKRQLRRLRENYALALLARFDKEGGGLSTDERLQWHQARRILAPSPR